MDNEYDSNWNVFIIVCILLAAFAYDWLTGKTAEIDEDMIR